MLSAINTALSGLNAASTRLNVSANNIANQFSRYYQPEQVDQVTLSPGGVQALVGNVNPATTTVADPSSPAGLSQLPNVNETQSLVDQMTASQSFQANLNTIKMANKMLQSLLDIQT